VPDLPQVRESVQQPEDSEDSEDVEEEQEHMDMVKLSDDEIVKAVSW
jgi:hypothetical protein